MLAVSFNVQPLATQNMKNKAFLRIAFYVYRDLPYHIIQSFMNLYSRVVCREKMTLYGNFMIANSIVKLSYLQ